MAPHQPQPSAAPPPPLPLKPDSRERVRQACQRCRWKKLRCDGVVPCTRCIQAGMCCQHRQRKKLSTEQSHVEYVAHLEEQQALLAAALRLTWSHLYPHESTATPRVHDMIARLRLLPADQRPQVQQSALTMLPPPGSADLDDLRTTDLAKVTRELQRAHGQLCHTPQRNYSVTSAESEYSASSEACTPEFGVADMGFVTDFELSIPLGDPAMMAFPPAPQNEALSNLQSYGLMADLIEPWKLSVG